VQTIVQGTFEELPQFGLGTGVFEELPYIDYFLTIP